MEDTGATAKAMPRPELLPIRPPFLFNIAPRFSRSPMQFKLSIFVVIILARGAICNALIPTPVTQLVCWSRLNQCRTPIDMSSRVGRLPTWCRRAIPVLPPAFCLAALLVPAPVLRVVPPLNQRTVTVPHPLSQQ